MDFLSASGVLFIYIEHLGNPNGLTQLGVIDIIISIIAFCVRKQINYIIGFVQKLYIFTVMLRYLNAVSAAPMRILLIFMYLF
jgi:hypothetical protein